MPGIEVAVLNLLTLAGLAYGLYRLLRFFRRDTATAIRRVSLFFGIVGVFTIATRLFWSVAPSIHAGDVRLMAMCGLFVTCGIGIGVVRIAHK